MSCSYEGKQHTISSSGGLRSSISDSAISHSTWYSLAISFITLSFTSPEGVLTESLSISCKHKVQHNQQLENCVWDWKYLRYVLDEHEMIAMPMKLPE